MVFVSFSMSNLPCIYFLSEWSTKVASEATDIGRSTFYLDSSLSNTFGFKIQDKQGRMHRFNHFTILVVVIALSLKSRWMWLKQDLHKIFMLDIVPFLISDFVAMFFRSWIYWKIPAEYFLIFFGRIKRDEQEASWAQCKTWCWIKTWSVVWCVMWCDAGKLEVYDVTTF